MARQNTLFPGNTILASSFFHQGRLAAGDLVNMIGIVSDELLIGENLLPTRIAQGFRTATRNLVSTGNILTTDFGVIVVATGITGTLPDPTLIDGQIFMVYNDHVTTGTTLDAASGHTIAGNPTFSLPAANDGVCLQAVAGDYVVVASSLAPPAIPGTVPQWVDIGNIGYVTFQAGANTVSVNVYTLPANSIIHAARMDLLSSLTGGALTGVTLSVGTLGDVEGILPAFNVFQAPGDTVFAISSVMQSYAKTTTKDIYITAVSAGAVLNDLASGGINLKLLISNP